MRSALGLSIVTLPGLSGCDAGYELRTPPAQVCFPVSPGRFTPLSTLGQDPSPFRVLDELVDARPGMLTIERKLTFEREPSGSTRTLRAVGRLDVDHFLAVGDGGTALHRVPARGW